METTTDQLTQTRNATVVVAGVEDNQVHQTAQLKRPPDAEVVVEVDLADGDPLEIRPHGVHLALVYADSGPVVAEGLFGVVETRASVPVAVIRDLLTSKDQQWTSRSCVRFFFIPPTMIIPGSNPGEILMEQLQIGI